MNPVKKEEKNGDGGVDPLSDERERRVLLAALQSFRVYRAATHFQVTHRRRQAFYALPPEHLQMLTEPPFSMLERFTEIDNAIDCNANIADEILRCGLAAFGVSEEEVEAAASSRTDSAKELDQSKAHSSIRQLFRDWSKEGSEERRLCHDYVLDQLKKCIKTRTFSNSQDFKTLVPGAGLGRLVYDISHAGFAVEGNEISYHQLLVSNWVLNHSGTVQRPFYPFATQFSNVRTREKQLREFMIPDILPATNPSGGGPFGKMSMSAGDFLLAYGGQDAKASFDVVVTVFFIDTAPNFIRYVDTVLNCLREGGIWINFGPLLWHQPEGKTTTENWDIQPPDGSDKTDCDRGIGEPGSVELTEEEVIWLLEKKGLHAEKRKESHYCYPKLDSVGYIQDPDSMFQNKYALSAWVAKRK